MSEELTVTPATEIRRPREEGYLFTLPSKRVVRLRPVQLGALIRRGKIPNLLIPVVAKMLWTEALDTDERTQEERLADDKKAFLDLVEYIAPEAMIYPRIVDEPKLDDEVSLDDFPFGDQYAIYTLAKMPAEVLDNFPGSVKGRTIQPIPDGNEVQPATEPDA